MERLSTETYSGLYQSKGKDFLPLIQKIRCRVNDKKACRREYAELLFMLEGTCTLSIENDPSCLIKAGETCFIPPNKAFSIKPHQDLSYLVIKIEDYISMYNQLDLKNAGTIPTAQVHKLTPLPWKPAAELFVATLSELLDSGMMESYFHEIKIKEIIFILKNYYSKEELKQLFAPILSGNFSFANFVLTHYMFVRTVKELARLSEYSMSGFEKEFKKVFDTSPHQWMMERKRERIYYDIKYTDKPLKNIAEEAGFINLSQLCDFCRHHFNNSPGRMRKV